MGKKLSTNKGVPGRLKADPSYYKFMRDVIKAPESVVAVYREGYRPPWISPPPSFQKFKNNKSARDDAVFLWEEVKRLDSLDCIEETKGPSSINHPWSVVFSKKMRALLDSSQHANPYLETKKTKLSDWSKVSEMIKKDWWYSVDDLDSGYWQVPLAPDQYDFFGCAAIDPSTGNLHYFRWKVLFLGINDAVRLFTDLCSPIINYIRSEKGIDASIYIDDLLAGGKSKELAVENREVVKNIFRKAGWLFSEKKGQPPSQSPEYLGFILDTKSMTFQIPAEKKEKILTLLKDLDGRKEVMIPVRFLASVVGNIIAVGRAVGPVTRLMTRNMILDIQKANSWDSWIKISSYSKVELGFWLKHLPLSEGFPVFASLSESRITYDLDRAEGYDFHTGGDASSSCGFGAEVSLNGETFTCFTFTEEEKKKSSTWREIYVIKKMYLSHQAERFRNSRILHSCDNLNVTRILEHGSRNPELQKMVMEIYLRCVSLGIMLDAEWRPREDPLMRLMDEGSRTDPHPPEEFSLGFDDFLLLTKKFGPFDVDLMASSFNRKAEKYFSKGFEFLSSGENVFSQVLQMGVNYYVLPPPRHVLKILLHLELYQARGLVVFPLWTSASWFMRIFPEGHLPSFVQDFLVFRPFFLADEEAISGVFRGRAKFDCVALYVDFKDMPAKAWDPVFWHKRCLKGGCKKCI